MVSSKYRGHPVLTCSSGCDVRVGVDKNGRALGTPAGPELRQLRMDTHAVFDLLWHRWATFRDIPVKKARGKAYVWMREAMGLSSEEAHIAMFTEDQCRTLIELAKAKNAETLKHHRQHGCPTFIGQRVETVLDHARKRVTVFPKGE